jgi:UDP-glucose 4-epimerase
MNSLDKFKNKKILIVGGAGFVGSNLSYQILKYEIAQLVIIDNLLSSNISNVSTDSRVLFINGSIADDNILKLIPPGINYVFHLACYHGNQSSISNPLEDHQNNTITSLKLFNHLVSFKDLIKVVYAAAGCAVAEKTFDKAKATNEDAPISLFHDSPYSISKIIGELYGNYYFTSNNLPFVKARFQNVYGPREILGAGRWRGTHNTVWRNVIPTFIWKSLNEEQLPLDNGGNASRDFIFVEDMAKGLMACALNGFPGEVYNLASGKETKILDLAIKINKLTGNKTPIKLNPARDWDRSGKRFGSIEKSKNNLGFQAAIDIDKGLSRTIEWTKNNSNLIKSCINQHNYFMNNL